MWLMFCIFTVHRGSQLLRALLKTAAKRTGAACSLLYSDSCHVACYGLEGELRILDFALV